VGRAIQCGYDVDPVFFCPTKVYNSSNSTVSLVVGAGGVSGTRSAAAVTQLITQLHTDRDGRTVGGVATAFNTLTDTLAAATQFTQLQRYHELLQKGEQRTAVETALMQQIAQRPELQPFLPQPTP
jgi:hypothetical protein